MVGSAPTGAAPPRSTQTVTALRVFDGGTTGVSAVNVFGAPMSEDAAAKINKNNANPFHVVLKSDLTSAPVCGQARDKCHVAGTPPNTSSCCDCTPWPHCAAGQGQNFICDGSPSDPNSRCVAGPPPPPWGTPCPAPPPNLLSTSATVDSSGHTVMLWIGNPFGWPIGGKPLQPSFCVLLAELEKLRDVVDTITVSGYYTADPSTGNISHGR
jgi:hypothetical protein